MRIGSLLLFEIAATILTTVAFLDGFVELGVSGIFLGTMALLSFFEPHPSFVNVLLGLYAIATGAFAVFRMPPLLCAAAFAAALVGWDAGRTAPHTAGAPRSHRRRFAFSYMLRATAAACLGLLLIAAAQSARIPMSFGLGLSLSLVGLILGALLLRLIRRHGEHAPSDDAPSSEHE